MWAIIKIDKKKFELFKIEMKKKLGGECKFYSPKLKIERVKNKKIKERTFYLLGDYIFCYNKQFNQKFFASQLKSIIGLKYIINNFFLAQNEIKIFIDKCKSLENSDGFIKENLFNIYVNKNYRFISGALSGTLFKIIEFNKSKINILIVNTKAMIDLKKSYLFNTA